MNHPPLWAEINLKALASNTRNLRRLTNPGSELMAVVKANGYGHGAAYSAYTALQNGASKVAVARFQEAIHLRESGITAPILLFGPAPIQDLEEVIRQNITVTIGALTEAKALSQKAVELNQKATFHLKIDSGMGRCGLLCDDMQHPNFRSSLLATIGQILALPGLFCEGIYTHFACADSYDKSSAKRQLSRFSALLDRIDSQHMPIPLRHAANSAALLDLPESHFGMVRPGISLYGLKPSSETDYSKAKLQPVFSLKARIARLTQIPAGFEVSYGSTWRSKQPGVIATIPVGYADGYSRSHSSRGFMLVKRQKAPIIGRVCMDFTIIDVSAIPGVSLEDEVTIIGRQGQREISVDQLADEQGTINYEITSAITARVPRVYL